MTHTQSFCSQLIDLKTDCLIVISEAPPVTPVFISLVTCDTADRGSFLSLGKSVACAECTLPSIVVHCLK